MSALLETHSLTAFYGDAQALFGIDFTLAAGEVVAIIGANGAGKSTFLKAITGLVRAAPDAVVYEGRPIGGSAPGAIVRAGIAMVPEGRRLFPSLSVEENLLMGTCALRTGPFTLERIYALFPVLKERRAQPATELSGGQQQMVAIGRALLSNPAVLLCDEISLGLAPVVIREIYAYLPSIVAAGLSVVLVEQDIEMARQASARAYCFQEGRVALSGTSAALTRADIAAAYFGTPA